MKAIPRGIPMKRLLSIFALVLALTMITALPASAYSGLASWYGPGFYYQYTASGDVFEPWDYTCASNEWALGTYLNITYNGYTLTCVVTDTGAFDTYGRSVDLSEGMATDLGLLYVGVDYVDIQYAGYDESWHYYKQY
jgi:rare lipoprotein A